MYFTYGSPLMNIMREDEVMRYRFYKIMMLIAILAGCRSIYACAESVSPVLDDRFQYAVQDGCVWIVVDGEVTLYNKRLDEIIGGFKVNAENLHITADSDFAYWVCAGGDSEYIMRIDTEGNIVGEQTLPEDISVIQIEAYSGGAVLITTTEEADMHQITGEVQLLSENGEIISIEGADNVSAIACDEKYLCAYSEIYGTMYIYDIETGGLLNLFPVYGVENFDIHKENIYALKYSANGALLERIDIKDGNSRIILEIEYDAVGLRICNGFMYICDIGASTLHAYEIPETNGDGVVLKIVVDSPGTAESARMGLAMEMTRAEYPDTEFEFVHEQNDFRLLTTLMSNEGGYDVVFLQEFGGVSARNFYKSGALADLSKSPVIMANWERLIDMEGIFGDNGGIFAVPYVVYPYVFQVNAPLFEEYGLVIPDSGWSWDEFFELADTVMTLRRAGADIVLLADDQKPFFLMQYNVNELSHGGIDYTNPIFARNMEKWRACIAEGAIEHTDYMYMFDCKENALFTVKQLQYSAMGEALFLQPPRYADDTRTPVYALSVGIVSLSDEREIAECFVANYISPEVLELPEHFYVYGALLADSSGAKYPEFARSDMPTQANKDFWAAALENGVQYVHIDEFMYEQYYDLYWSYIEGALDIEDFVTLSRQKADMATGE